MSYLTPEAKGRLDDYLTEVRAALAGCSSVDADEIEQDICAHIGAEFPPSFGPVSKLDLEPVLARLGRPEQWVPEGGDASPLRRAAERLRRLPAEGKKVGQAAVEGLRHIPEQAKWLGGAALEGLRHIPEQAKWLGGAALGGLRLVPEGGKKAGEVALAGLRLVPEGGKKVGEAAAEGLSHIGAGGQRVSGAVSAWLAQGPDDWRLAYISFGLLALGLVIPPLLILLLPASFCVARASVARAQERDEPLGARRWLVYPPLVLVSLVLFVPLFLWPTIPAAVGADDLWRHYRGEFLQMLSPLPRDLVEGLLYTYLMAAGLGVWWAVLGTVLWVVPRLAVVVFRPFADGFGRRQAGFLVLTGLAIVALCLSVAVRVVNSDRFPLSDTREGNVPTYKAPVYPK
jgi:hypothetical protein